MGQPGLPDKDNLTSLRLCLGWQKTFLETPLRTSSGSSLGPWALPTGCNRGWAQQCAILPWNQHIAAHTAVLR